MRSLVIGMIAIVALGASTASFAQGSSRLRARAENRTDRAFTATDTSCDHVMWSQEARAQYPNIAMACQAVMERDGKYYVKFQGDVQRVRNRGQDVTVNFKDGGTMTLNPPEDVSLEINGRSTRPSGLRPGDQLTFYVPQDQLTADFFANDPPSAPPVAVVAIVPVQRQRVAAADTAQPQPSGQQLPHTAGPLPWIGVAGLAFAMLGATLTTARRRRYP